MLSHAECSSTGVGGLLAVACEGVSPLPKTSLMTINGPSGISNSSTLAAAPVHVPWDQRDNSCCSRPNIWQKGRKVEVRKVVSRDSGTEDHVRRCRHR